VEAINLIGEERIAKEWKSFIVGVGSGLCGGAEVAGLRWQRERRRLMLWGVNNDLIMSK
jgi:hypothetical protein